MIVLKLFVLLIGFCAGMILATVGVRSFAPVWNRLIDKYVSWILRTYREIGQEMSIGSARRLVTIAIFVPSVLVMLLKAWPLLVVAIPAGLLIPYGWVYRQRKVHLETMDSQLVDALVLMANSMKSGLSLMQAVEMAATELKPPIATQFETVLREVQLGRSIDQALRMFDPLQFNEEHGEVCPANWHTGEKAMKATAEGVADYLAQRN